MALLDHHQLQMINLTMAFLFRLPNGGETEEQLTVMTDVLNKLDIHPSWVANNVVRFSSRSELLGHIIPIIDIT
ncbi:hypothetical protein HO173_008057 [Letharia columbiana]|uniref:Uncharacterized protein n=1 Tax=Letharia columbiana TaxID=112416 RepID=A0A8H6L369_9LECA|nr:uncharacterized protein HO173_008057 [Letharia columbiana]KAF6233845.1 hypothetical protein HO173_008057 [Letharia columbiana]